MIVFGSEKTELFYNHIQGYANYVTFINCYVIIEHIDMLIFACSKNVFAI